MEQVGKLITCDRCGRSIFLTLTGKEDWSDRLSYQEKPREWTQEIGHGDLCPDCTKEFQTFCKEFFKNTGGTWTYVSEYKEKQND